MSELIQEIIRAVDEEIRPNLPKMNSERARIDMRHTILGMEKMLKHIRRELLKETKELKLARKNKKQQKLELNNNLLEKEKTNNIEKTEDATEKEEE